MFSNSWKLQDAKKHFSEVVNCAMKNGPQKVTRQEKDVVVVLSFELYQQLVQPEKSLFEFFQSSPLNGVELDCGR